MMSNNQLIWPLTLLSIVVLAIAGAILLIYPDTGTTLVISFGTIAVVVIPHLVSLKQAAETKAAVIEAKEQGLQNAEELKANTLETKVVSEQNAQEIGKLHQMLNSERDGMKNELKAQRADILDLKLLVDRLLGQLDLKQAVITEQAATIAAAPSKDAE